MTIKTILVHLANDAGHRARLEIGQVLARQFQAHLVLLYVTAPVHMPAAIAGRGASAVFLAEARERSAEQAAAIESEMARTDMGPDTSWEFRIDHGEHIQVLTDYSHYADLAIVSKAAEGDTVDLVSLHRPDDLPLNAGCPVLVVPQTTSAPDLDRPILIAWKAGKEVARAVHSAMPLLVAAPKVYVLAARNKHDLEAPGVVLGNYLARHGVDVEVLPEDDDRGEPGVRICEQAVALDCSMIVMGAYGRSRLSEILFGGTTRYVLTRAERPVLLSN